MILSERALDFSRLILKNYGSKKKEKLNNPEPDKSEQEQAVDPLDKYSLDYEKKWNNLEKEENQDKGFPKELEDNPYLKQIACTHDRRKEREIYEKPTKEKLDAAELFKSEGNKAIKDKEYDKAAYFYQKALLQFDYTFPDTEEENRRFDTLKEACHMNMALAKYAQKDNDECLTNCEQVLKLNPKNIKALYRKAVVYFDRDLFNETRKEIESILKIDCKHQETLELESKLKEKEKSYKMRQKDVYKQMFQEKSK